MASARLGSDEFIKEYIISHQKISFLIRDLIATEIWHQKVFLRLVHSLDENSSTFPIYIVLYHELVVVNLLETVTYHEDVIDSLSDDAVDLCDWCQRALCRLVASTSTREKKEQIKNSKDHVCLFR